MGEVLIVEDEQHLANGLRFNLEAKATKSRLPVTAKRRWSYCSADPNVLTPWCWT